MRIIHVCLAAFYIDDFSYQENIFPKIHKNLGHEVFILASTETYIDKVNLGYVEANEYKTSNNIPIKRIPYVSWLPHILCKKLRIYEGVSNYLQKTNPDIIFLHDCQFLSILSIVDYVKKNKNVKVYVDSHTDYINSGRNWISKYIFHKAIYRFCAKSIEKYATKFYGTLPLRCEFLNEVYNISLDKIELLPFGADDTLFEYNKKATVRNEMRHDLNLKQNDIVLITGGKIDSRKNIHVLIEAFIRLLEEHNIYNLKLIVFGKPEEKLREKVLKDMNHASIRYIDWVSAENIYKYFWAADLAIFPGTHSVLWEEAIGLGLPCVFYKWQGIQHVDVGGNCIFIEEATIESLMSLLLMIVEDKIGLEKMKQQAEKLGYEKFSYSKIALQAISN